jgi:hypothetical protein
VRTDRNTCTKGPPEREVLRSCLEYLRLRGHFVLRVNGGGFRTEGGGYVRCTDTPGCADILGITREGEPLAAECKSGGGKQSPAQRRFQAEWEERGGLYVLARSSDDLQEAGL